MPQGVYATMHEPMRHGTASGDSREKRLFSEDHAMIVRPVGLARSFSIAACERLNIMKAHICKISAEECRKKLMAHNFRHPSCRVQSALGDCPP